MKTTDTVTLFCGDCGARGEMDALRVTASLRCRCGSANLGVEGIDDVGGITAQAQQHLAYPKGPGTGWTGPDQRRFDGLNLYEGPTPQTYPRTPPVSMARTCPVCHGSKYDLIDKGPCRECGGTGYVTHPTDASSAPNPDPGRRSPAGGAGSFSARLDRALASDFRAMGGLSAEAQARLGGRASTDPYGSVEQHIQSTTPGYNGNPAKLPNVSPLVKTREDRDYDQATGPYQMDQAACPNCGHAPTELRKDNREDAWWTCPQCGPLANIDRNPEVNPYSPPQGFTPDRNMKTGGFLPRKKTGRLLAMLAKIAEANDGLTESEALDIARNTIKAYPEGR